MVSLEDPQVTMGFNPAALRHQAGYHLRPPAPVTEACDWGDFYGV